MTGPNVAYADLHDHLEALKQAGLLLTIDRPIDKDAELHPLVRWQFVGGIDESAPTLTATNVITRDPDTGVQNHGTYRAALKAADRLVIRMATRIGGAGGYRHYVKHQQRGDTTMPCAIVLGAPPCVAFVAPQ